MIEFSDEQLELIRQKWVEHDVQQSQDFFSGGLDWLDDDLEEDSEDSEDDNEVIMSEALIELKIALDELSKHSCLRTAGRWLWLTAPKR